MCEFLYSFKVFSFWQSVTYAARIITFTLFSSLDGFNCIDACQSFTFAKLCLISPKDVEAQRRLLIVCVYISVYVSVKSDFIALC
jgi:hypothetical protein